MSQMANASTGMTTMMARWPAESIELGYGPMESSEYGYMVASLRERTRSALPGREVPARRAGSTQERVMTTLMAPVSAGRENVS